MQLIEFTWLKIFSGCPEFTSVGMRPIKNYGDFTDKANLLFIPFDTRISHYNALTTNSVHKLLRFDRIRVKTLVIGILSTIPKK